MSDSCMSSSGIPPPASMSRSAVRPHHERARVDGDERPRRNGLELFDQPAWPALDRLALEVPRRAVVGEDEPIALHRVEHRLRVLTVAPHVEAALEPETRAHRRV